MGFIKLEPRCPKRSEIVHSVDPDPNWTVDSLLAELQFIEAKLGPPTLSPLKQLPDSLEFRKAEENVGSGRKPFVMRVLDDDINFDQMSDGSEDEVERDSSLVNGTRFCFNDIEMSDSETSEDELSVSTTHCTLIHKRSLEEDILFELEREHQLKVKEQVRNTVSAIKLQQQKEHERSSLARIQLEKQIEERREMDRRVDKQYQRKMAEVLDSHLSALQRDHEKRSQIVERSIRDEAIEEAKRKEKALYEEKLRQKKAKAEEEARLKAAKIVEEKNLALEAARRAAEEAAQRESQTAAEEAAQKAAAQKVDTGAERQKGDSSTEESASIHGRDQSCGCRCCSQAEANRLRIYNDVVRETANIPHKDIERYGRRIFKTVNQISGTLDIVRSKAHDLINIINSSGFPHLISIFIFAQKVVSLCESPRGSSDRTIFACAHVIVLISSQIPDVMDFVIAELNKACVYTVPKHLYPSNHTVRNNDYWKLVGYREEDNKLESSDSYHKRMRAYTSLYAALIQTEIQGIGNPHGLQHGWAWLAMFLNSLPPNRSTAIALDAFLRMAGFALFRRYKSQFMKILDVVSQSFLHRLKERDDQKLKEIIQRLDEYLKDRKYKEEPEGWRLQESYLLSEQLV